MKGGIKLVSQGHRERAVNMILSAPDGYIVTVKEPTRNLDQNAKLHAMLGDLRKQVEEFAPFSIDDMKKRFMHGLGIEARWLPELDGPGMFPIGLSTSTLTTKQFALLIELVYAKGAQYDVQWSEPMPEYLEAK